MGSPAFLLSLFVSIERLQQVLLAVCSAPCLGDRCTVTASLALQQCVFNLRAVQPCSLEKKHLSPLFSAWVSGRGFSLFFWFQVFLFCHLPLLFSTTSLLLSFHVSGKTDQVVQYCSSYIAHVYTAAPSAHSRQYKGSWERSQLCTPLSFTVQKGNKILCRNTLLSACDDLEMFGKIFPPRNPKCLSLRGGERGGRWRVVFFSRIYLKTEEYSGRVSMSARGRGQRIKGSSQLAFYSWKGAVRRN